MHWIDVFGPPGVGKSTLCNPLWHEHTFKGQRAPIPVQWRQFIIELDSIMRIISRHPVEQTFVAAVRMNVRSLYKMACVFHHESETPYVQTGFIQRITGFGWRLKSMGADVNLIRPLLWTMPLSSGVAFLTAPVKVVKERNKRRLDDSKTAYENREYQVDLMLPSVSIIKDVLSKRNVPFISIDVHGQCEDDSREELTVFANKNASYSETHRHFSEKELLWAPEWLR